MEMHYFIVNSESPMGEYYRQIRDKIMVFDRLLADFSTEYGILSTKYDPYKYVRQADSFTFSPYVRPICAEWVMVQSDTHGLCFVPQDQSVEPRHYFNELRRSAVSLADMFRPLHLGPSDICTYWAMSYRYIVFCINTAENFKPVDGLKEISVDLYTQLSYPRNIIASNNLSKHNRIYVRNF